MGLQCQLLRKNFCLSAYFHCIMILPNNCVLAVSLPFWRYLGNIEPSALPFRGVHDISLVRCFVKGEKSFERRDRSKRSFFSCCASAVAMMDLPYLTRQKIILVRSRYKGSRALQPQPIRHAFYPFARSAGFPRRRQRPLHPRLPVHPWF